MVSNFRKTLNVRYIFYILLIMVVALPLLKPIGLPFVITQTTRDLYKGIEEIPAGSVVLNAPDLTVSNIPELAQGIEVDVMQHLISRPIKVIVVTFIVQDSALIFQTYTLPNIKFGDKKYGVDWVYLGYIAGGEVSMAAFAMDIHKVATKDFYGTSIEDLPMMANIKTARDIRTLIDVCPLIYCVSYIRQFQAAYGMRIGIGGQSMYYPATMPYYQSGQIFGMTNGLRGAAEYELLSGKMGYGASASDALSTSHILIMAFIILGNLSYFIKKNRERRR